MPRMMHRALNFPNWLAFGTSFSCWRFCTLAACHNARLEIGDRLADLLRPNREQGHNAGTIVIEDDVWLGANVTVVGGVRIGHGAVVAAGAVVTDDVEPWTVVGGVPARLLKRRRGNGKA